MPASPDFFSPEIKHSPYWWEAAAPQDERGDLPAACDVVIIGSGYAGLSTALELARNGTQVLVMDAEALGYGASSRNGGHVSGLNVGKGPASGRKSPVEIALGSQRYQEILGGGETALQNFETLVEREKIDCDLNYSGRFLGAYTPRHFEGMKAKVDSLNKAADVGARLLSRADQHQEIASDHFYGGMTVDRLYCVHPAKLHRGLLDACRKVGVTFRSHCAMTGITRQPDGSFRVTTSQGEIRAKEVVTGTNAYTRPASPWLRRRLVPAYSHLIATEELPDDLAKTLIPNYRAMGDTKRVMNYFRMSPDRKRLIFGGRAKLAVTDRRSPAEVLYQQMTTVYPQLKGTKVSHSWSGGVAFAFDFLPHMGRYQDGPQQGSHYLAACNGSGVAMMSYLGTQTAKKILGQSNAPCPFDELPFPTKPFYSGNPWFIPLVLNYYALCDAWDRRQAA
ncbi:NAD(P)/FAD-dependent oxidoreductase [Rhodovibrionaceae bacterium A322]